MLWLITDTHFGHANMVRLCNRPKDFDNMIMDNWKKMVKPTDTVIHLGDVAWNDDMLKQAMKLQGNKILIRGNHDKKTTATYMEYGFLVVCDKMSMTFDGMTIVFSHKPLKEFDEDINIHGHLHNLYRGCGKRWLPLALETMGYRPIAMNKEFLHTLHKWCGNNYIPSLQEIIELRQSYCGVSRECDIYGSLSFKGERFINAGKDKIYTVFFKHNGTKDMLSMTIEAQSPNEAQNKFLSLSYEQIEQSTGSQVRGRLRVVTIND